ncbi:hypothetical protein [Sphingobium sp.]|uniref:hypothetical protein n=1 Tax=Sphingobium sp. TaxID=1912891 RepID=UPI002CD86574|nr:hypothetical protein [Sphingobium sp.]HUD90577.1 hypothetical protein [Sphingobium sp.]
MPFAALLGGTIVPLLLMLSPFAVMAMRDCPDRISATGHAASPGNSPCNRPSLPLM